MTFSFRLWLTCTEEAIRRYTSDWTFRWVLVHLLNGHTCLCLHRFDFSKKPRQPHRISSPGVKFIPDPHVTKAHSPFLKTYVLCLNSPVFPSLNKASWLSLDFKGILRMCLIFVSSLCGPNCYMCWLSTTKKTKVKFVPLPLAIIITFELRCIAHISINFLCTFVFFIRGKFQL